MVDIHDVHFSFGKNVEFKRFLNLPVRVSPTVRELAVNEGKTRRIPRELLVHKGWQIVDRAAACPDFDSYHTYHIYHTGIESSKLERSLAKNGYVVSQPGWFSYGSACYLAAIGPTLYDLAYFTYGMEPQPRYLILDAYRRAAVQSGVPVPAETQMQYIANCLGLHRIFDWLSRGLEKRFTEHKVAKLVDRAEQLSAILCL